MGGVDERAKRGPRPAARQRLDQALVTRGLSESRARAQALILARSVLVDGQVADKASQMVSEATAIRLAASARFVSRGGEKLERAIVDFAIDPAGLICADIGASTGGFTDCLLSHGARRVYAIDVGYGLLHWQLRQDPRVVSIERTNIRYVETLPEPIDLAVVDVSFIGLELVLPVVRRFVVPTGQAVVLIKPQFEAGRGAVGRGGVVRDEATHRAVLHRLVGVIEATGWGLGGLIPSPLRGPAGNVEFLAWLVASDCNALRTLTLEERTLFVERCLAAVTGSRPRPNVELE